MRKYGSGKLGKNSLMTAQQSMTVLGDGHKKLEKCAYKGQKRYFHVKQRCFLVILRGGRELWHGLWRGGGNWF